MQPIDPRYIIAASHEKLPAQFVWVKASFMNMYAYIIPKIFADRIEYL